MTTDGRELLGLALALEDEGAEDERVIDALVEASRCSPTALMAAYAFALSLARDLPYDTSNERTLGLITRALQRAVRLSGQRQAADGTPGLLRHIEEVAGQAAVRPDAVASRTAEVDADLVGLWPDPGRRHREPPAAPEGTGPPGAAAG
ncbi:MAG: hypothetical protein ACLGIO_08355 [Acidimicrobiia bacterium]